MAIIWEKAISILAGNLNLGRSYLGSFVNVKCEWVIIYCLWSWTNMLCAFEIFAFLYQEKYHMKLKSIRRFQNLEFTIPIFNVEIELSMYLDCQFSFKIVLVRKHQFSYYIFICTNFKVEFLDLKSRLNCFYIMKR